MKKKEDEIKDLRTRVSNLEDGVRNLWLVHYDDQQKLRLVRERIEELLRGRQPHGFQAFDVTITPKKPKASDYWGNYD